MTAAAGAIARFDRVAKWYGSVIGLVDVSVGIGPGVTGLLGPNGAGKSTFLKLLTGQLTPSQGVVTLFGKNPFRHTELHRDIGYMPEPDAFYEHLDGRSFVRFLTRLHGFGRIEAHRRAEAALERVGLIEAAGRRIGGYSKGMRQRLKLAQAIAHEPSVLVLDEPLTGMDPVARRFTMDLLRELGSSGVTVLVSSHVLHEVEAMTRNVLLLYQGRLRAHGSQEEIRGFLDRHPHRVRIRTPRGRDLARRLIDCPGVVGIRLNGADVNVETRSPDDLFDRLPRAAVDDGIPIEAIESEDLGLDAIFSYLVQ